MLLNSELTVDGMCQPLLAFVSLYQPVLAIVSMHLSGLPCIRLFSVLPVIACICMCLLVFVCVSLDQPTLAYSCLCLPVLDYIRLHKPFVILCYPVAANLEEIQNQHNQTREMKMTVKTLINIINVYSKQYIILYKNKYGHGSDLRHNVVFIPLDIRRTTRTRKIGVV